MKFAIKAKSSVATPQEIKLAYRQSGMLHVANITNQLEMTGIKEIQAEFLNAPPKYLELAVLIFLGCVTFYFIPVSSGGSMRKKGILLDEGSTGTEERSGSDYSNSPPLSPSGIIVDCDPLRPKNVANRQTKHAGKVSDLLEYSETDASTSENERSKRRRAPLNERFT